MKKILALVLALVMVLAACTALADGSKRNNDIAAGDTDEETVSMTAIAPTEKLQEIMDGIKAANDEQGDPIKGLPEDAAAQIPEGFTAINDMGCWQLEGDVTGLSELELIFKFETPYPEGDEVALLIGIAPADGDVEWIEKTGVANADGAVVVKVTAAELAKISNNPFLAIPLSK